MVEKGRKSWLEEQVESAEANFSSGGCRACIGYTLAALTRNEVEGSKFLSLTANLSGWVFTSGLRVAWGTVFTVCCIPRKLELGLERAGRRISGRIIISGYIRFLKFSIIDIAK